MLRRLRLADPGYARVRQAGRALVAVSMGGGSTALVLAAVDHSMTPAAVAGLLGMLGVLTRPPGGRWSGVAHGGRVALAAVVGASSAALVADGSTVGYGIFLVLMAVGAWLTRWGRAGTGAGMVLFMTHVVARFLGLSSGDAPWLLLATGCGVGAFFVASSLLRDRPVRHVRRLLRALDEALDRYVEGVVDLLDVSSGDVGAAERARGALRAVQDIALQIDMVLDEPAAGDQVAGLDDLRDRVLVVEVLADHLMWSVVRRSAPSPRAPDEAERLRLAWRAEDPAGAAVTGTIPVVGALPAPDPATTASIVAQLRARRAELAPAAVGSSPPDPEGRDWADPAPAPAPPAGRPTPASPIDPVWRKVLQAVVAGALAMAVGLQLSATYWLWAVIGAFVVVVTTPSRGVGLRKAVDRIIGTTVGVAVGLALATVLSGWGGVELVVIFALAFAALWVVQASYTWTVASFTTMVAVLYEVMGQLSVAVLAVRLAETAVGAVIGGAVTFFLVPVTTRSVVNQSVAAVLAAVDEVLQALVHDPLAGPALGPIRRLDRVVDDLHTGTQALVGAGWIDANGQVRRARHLATAVRFRVRALAVACRLDGVSWLGLDDESVQVLLAVRQGLRAMGRDLGASFDGDLPPGDLGAGDGPVATALRELHEQLVAFRDGEGP